MKKNKKIVFRNKKKIKKINKIEKMKKNIKMK